MLLIFLSVSLAPITESSDVINFADNSARALGKQIIQAELSHSMSTKRQVQNNIFVVNARYKIQSVRSTRMMRTRLTRSPRLPDTYYLDTSYWIHKLIPGFHRAWLLILLPDGTRGDFTSRAITLTVCQRQACDFVSL